MKLPFFCLPCIPHILPMSSYMIWSSWLYLERSTSYEIPHCATLPSFVSFWSRCSPHRLSVDDSESVIFSLKWHSQTADKTWKDQMMERLGRMLDDRGIGIWFQTRAGVICLPYSRLLICPRSPPSRLCTRWVGSSRGVTRPGPIVYYPSVCRTDVKDVWRFTSILSYIFMACWILLASYTLWGSQEWIFKCNLDELQAVEC
jgi:hypothetical protein